MFNVVFLNVCGKYYCEVDYQSLRIVVNFKLKLKKYEMFIMMMNFLQRCEDICGDFL